MFEEFGRFFTMRGLPPHGYCLLWEPSLIWTHVVADAIIAAAYFSIPIVLWQLLRLRRDIEFGWLLALFATFILACGTTHLFNIYVLWVPAYGIEATVKAITAAASIGTAVLLIPLLPKLAAIPSPAQLQAVNQRLVEEAAERERTAEMLRQSQKLEAVGQLTGGVAHDFNNLLHVVIGNLDRARRAAGPSDPKVDRALESALAGAERAAELVDQLLAFSRRQPLKPKPHSPAELVENVRPLVQRALGSQIELVIAIPADAPQVLADRNQLENALLNLAINARDAMPDSGTFTVGLDPDPAGHPDMIELRATDTGCGMDKETVERAFEPFFTTKPVGQGTGLGLSQVYGMASQLGGAVEIDSSPGTGSTIRIFLPRAREN